MMLESNEKGRKAHQLLFLSFQMRAGLLGGGVCVGQGNDAAYC